MWHNIRPNQRTAFLFSRGGRLQQAPREPVPAEAGFQDLASWTKSRRHPDDFGCQQGGCREGRGFPGPPSQSPGSLSRETPVRISVGISSPNDRSRVKTENFLSCANELSLEKK
jgi:hypothetical protein